MRFRSCCGGERCRFRGFRHRVRGDNASRHHCNLRGGTAERRGGLPQASSPSSEVVIVGASRGAADDFARSIARPAGATFGLMRFSLTELAARAAAVRLAGASRAPLTQAGAEATAARVVFDALGAEELEYFVPVASMPGFPKALARTLHELRLAAIAPDRLMASAADPVRPCRLAGEPRYRAPARSCRRADGPCGCQRSRGAVSPRS